MEPPDPSQLGNLFDQDPRVRPEGARSEVLKFFLQATAEAWGRPECLAERLGVELDRVEDHEPSLSYAWAAGMVFTLPLRNCATRRRSSATSSSG